ncbi:MAG TPA: CotH kinase family protein, partial [Kofleriaceae bacterium]
VQVAVEMEAGGGEPEAWPEAWIEVGAERVAARVESAGVTSGLTALVIVPAADEEEHAGRLAAAAAILDALPADERVAVLVAQGEPVLIAELSADRTHARAQIAALPPEADRSAGSSMADLRAEVADLENKYTSLGRSIIVIGEEVAETTAGIQRPVQTFSLLASGDAPAVVSEMAARRAAIVRVGACPGLQEGQAFTLRIGDAEARLVGPEPMEHLAGEECRRNAAASDAFPFPDEIDLTFTAAERAIFDERVAGPSEEPFRTSVTLGAGAPLPAEAHLRGAGSLNCQRKSFSVTLDGSRRRLMPDLATDRFFLISMCLDTRYFGQVFGDRLLAGLGLFPPRMRYVVLRIDGVNQGVYLMLHQPERAFRDASLGIASVVRRRYDIDLEPAEVKYPSDPVEAEEARLRFEALGDLALAEPPETLEAALDGRLELDAYLSMLALYSLLENGDYIDEAFFASSIEGAAERYRVMGWDTDDLFSLCHGGGGRGIEDDCGVAYCAEAELDYSLLRSPAIYARYLDQLAAVMSDLSAERLETTMDAVRDDLWRVLDDDETAAALIEMVAENPDAATVAGARADIAGAMNAVLSRIETRRASLTELLDACPAAVARQR